jgi:tRNA pseudouridine38-40 synthase
MPEISEMPHFRVTVSYDGTEFVGWQRQATGVSVQGLLEDALADLDGRAVAVVGAGRTDAGVHAIGQIAAFSLERSIACRVLVGAINARLPETVRVVGAAEVPAAFHARFDAASKRYLYRMWNADVMSPLERRYAWHVPGALDVEAMSAASRLLEGRHDFSAFRAAGSTVQSSVRVVFRSEIRRSVAALAGLTGSQNPLLVYEISASGFLRHMVRTIVGSLVEVGRGRHPAEWIVNLLVAGDRGQAGPTAPAAGLFLISVTYESSALATGS